MFRWMAAFTSLPLVASSCRTGSTPMRDDGRATASSEAATRDKDNAALHTLGEELGLRFSSETRLIGLARYNGRDDAVRVKAIMTEHGWTTFLLSIPLADDRLQAGRVSCLGADDGFFDPRKAAGLRAAQVHRPNGRALNIGVAPGPAPSEVTVYVFEFGT